MGADRLVAAAFVQSSGIGETDLVENPILHEGGHKRHCLGVRNRRFQRLEDILVHGQRFRAGRTISVGHEFTVWFQDLEGIFQNRTDELPNLAGWCVGNGNVGQIAEDVVELFAIFDVFVQEDHTIADYDLKYSLIKRVFFSIETSNSPHNYHPYASPKHRHK
jgi:hypothetical protein